MAKYTEDFLTIAHRGSIRHIKEIQDSKLCGCFCCCLTFLPTEIEQWIKDGTEESDQTAICPKCNIDSVLSDNYPVNDKIFLQEMKEIWF